jgi:phosphoribosylaminoimidazole carboxylase (NCAIR synthetase)
MRIGIIGAGQLGQMLGFAARDLGYECRFIDPSESPPAAVIGQVTSAPFDDATALAALSDECDVLTYEFENVPVEALLPIARSSPVYPPAEALRHAQDRLAEKMLFTQLNIPLPDYRIVDSRDDLVASVAPYRRKVGPVRPGGFSDRRPQRGRRYCHLPADAQRARRGHPAYEPCSVRGPGDGIGGPTLHR